MEKGIAVSVLRNGVKRERLLPMNHAPGSPMASETSTLKNACLKVNRVILSRVVFPRTDISPGTLDVFKPSARARIAGAKLAAYGKMKEKAAASTGGRARRQAAVFFVNFYPLRFLT